MKNIITYETLDLFAYSSIELLRNAPKGICIEFWGYCDCGMQSEHTVRAKLLAEKDIAVVTPYLNPWNWCNEAACKRVDMILDVIEQHFGRKLPIVSTGGSMGGLSAIVYSRYSRHNVVACVANCPVCDLPYHFTERPDLPHTIFDAFYDCMDFEAEMKARSPLHLAKELPEIEYHIFHCDADQAVNIDKHSRAFVGEMQSKNITFDVVPGRGHCQLTDEKVDKYNSYIINSMK